MAGLLLLPSIPLDTILDHLSLHTLATCRRYSIYVVWQGRATIPRVSTTFRSLIDCSPAARRLAVVGPPEVQK